MVNHLGPFQDIWEAWNAAGEEMQEKGVDHFETAVTVQFLELKQHLVNDKREKAAMEAIDVISIALNLLRKLDYEPEEIAGLAKVRARDRMAGQTREILQKYSTLYGI
jgi:hypothetical protein